MYLLILKSTNQHLWSVQIGISISPIVEISIFDRSDAIATNVFVDKIDLCRHWNWQINISDPLKSASASLWSLRSAYLIIEIRIATIASNVFVDPEIDKSASLIRWNRHQHLCDCVDQHIWSLKAASLMQLQAIYITSVHAVGQGWVALLTDVGIHVACRGHNRLWAMAACCMFQCVWTHTCTSCDGWLHSWCACHNSGWVRTHWLWLQSGFQDQIWWFQRSEQCLPISKDQRCRFVDLSAGAIFIRSTNTMLRDAIEIILKKCHEICENIL